MKHTQGMSPTTLELFREKRVLITGGTGSLGSTLVRRLLECGEGSPSRIVVFSRDEMKQHAMRAEYNLGTFGHDISQRFRETVEFRIGDIRDFHSISDALSNVEIVFNAAALKQVPTGEYFPYEAVRTNVEGPENIIRAIQEFRLGIDTVVSVSTDKACKPVNAMGMSKALQERLFVHANLRCGGTRFICVRFGNILGTRGSIIPLFQNQVRCGGPVTITTPEMTRFLLSRDRAVDSIFEAVRSALPGEVYIPRARSAHITDVAKVLIGEQSIQTKMIGIRPGEKVHEILVSSEELGRTWEDGDNFIISPLLPELASVRSGYGRPVNEYSSAESLMSYDELERLLRDAMSDQRPDDKAAGASQA